MIYECYNSLPATLLAPQQALSYHSTSRCYDSTLLHCPPRRCLSIGRLGDYLVTRASGSCNNGGGSQQGTQSERRYAHASITTQAQCTDAQRSGVACEDACVLAHFCARAVLNVQGEVVP